MFGGVPGEGFDMQNLNSQSKITKFCNQSGNNDFGVKLGQNDTFDPI